jgi:hypothetical protein
VPTQTKDDFAAKAQQAIFAGEDQFLDLTVNNESEKFHERCLLVVHARSQLFDDQVGLVLLEHLFLGFQIDFWS